MKNEITINEAIEQQKKQSVNDLFESWKKYIDAMPKTVKTYTGAINQFSKYLNKNGITQPTRENILAYRDYLLEHYKATTVQNYITAVKLFFSWASQEGLYKNVAEHVKGAKIDNEHKKEYLTTRQVKALFESVDRTTLKGKRDYAMLTLMITTGLRTISIVDANIDDICPAGDSMVLYYRGKGHNEKATYVKLAAQVETAINDYLRARGETDNTRPLFTSTGNHNNNGRLTTKTISLTVKEYLKAIGLDGERYTAHSLRHTAATVNLMNGGTLEETQQLLGHKSITTTMIYAHNLEREKNNSENRIADAIFVA